MGGGFTGTALAATLRERSADPIQVLLFERSGDFGAGLAFATHDPHHLLNVPAAKMSAFADRPDDFTDWLAEQGIDPGDGFVPRRQYRNYLRDRLHRPSLHSGSELVTVSQEVVAIEDSFRLTTREGDLYDADFVVLATGYARRALRAFHAYEPDRWPDGKLERVAIVGSGLSAIDAAISVFERFPGVNVEMFSRHGLLPEPFGMPTMAVSLATEPPSGDLRRMLRWLREEIAGAGWEPVFDSMRFRWEALWRSLSDRDRLRFTRHLAHRFNRFRHRVPHGLWLKIADYREAGRLVLRVGHVCDAGPNRLRLIDGAEFRFDAVIDAAGPSFSWASGGEDLIDHLLEAGRIEVGPIGLGFKASSGESHLFVLGPPLRGQSWESTAVPDIRRQILDVCNRILGV